MITVAAGIILAVLFFALIPYIVALLGWLFGIVVLALCAGGLFYFVWIVAGEPGGLGVLCIIGGVSLVIWHFNRKAAKKEPMSNDEFRRRYPYLSAKLDRDEKR